MPQGKTVGDYGYGEAWYRSWLPTREVSPEGARCLELLNYVYRGIYHIQSDVLRADFSKQSVVIRVGGHLSTYDDPTLTMLVMAAHMLAIRVEITPANFSHITMHLSPRRRSAPEGGWPLYYCHPTLERHITAIKDKLPLPEYDDPAPAGP